jgi:hypothetical protein
VIADEYRDQARRRCATWKREDAVDGVDREHVTVLRPRRGARTGVPDRAAAVAALPPPFEAGRKRAPRCRQVPERPVRERASGRVAIVHQQCKRASPARRRRPSKRRGHVRASAGVASRNARARVKCRADQCQNCGENVHGRNLAAGGRRSSTGLLLAATPDTSATATEPRTLGVRELHSWSVRVSGLQMQMRCRRFSPTRVIFLTSSTVGHNDTRVAHVSGPRSLSHFQQTATATRGVEFVPARARDYHIGSFDVI